jgi:hypothetical protein
MGWTKEQRDEIYRRALAACRPKAKPPIKTAAQKAQERFAEANKPTEAIIDAATDHNNALADRSEETMEGRRQKQIAKELAEYHAENPLWHKLCRWQQSVLDAEEAVRARYGEIPERGVYSPVARFEREMEGK